MIISAFVHLVWQNKATFRARRGHLILKGWFWASLGSRLCLFLKMCNYSASNWSYEGVCFVFGSIIFSKMLTLSSTLIRAPVRHGCQAAFGQRWQGAQTDWQPCLSPTCLASKSQFKNNNNKQPRNNERDDTVSGPDLRHWSLWFQYNECRSKFVFLLNSHIYVIDWLGPKRR